MRMKHASMPGCCGCETVSETDVLVEGSVSFSHIGITFCVKDLLDQVLNSVPIFVFTKSFQKSQLPE